MAKFKIDYLKNDDTILPLIDYVTGHNNINTYSCYDEQLEKTTNSECTLTFKMMQYIYRNGEKVLNVYAQQLTHGAQLRLREKDDTYTLFVITRVDYAISSQNIELSYTAIDLFHYALSRRNQGYTILNDSDNFIGALHFNDWVKKIQDECYLSDWTYIPVADEMNDFLAFEVSSSNALNALVELADKNEYNINVQYTYNENDVLTKSFTFEWKKNPKFSGFIYNSQLDLQSLSVSTNSEQIATILNVTGQTDVNDNEITLMPQIPTALLTTIGATTNTTNMTIVTGKDEYKYTQANELTSRYVKKVGDNEFFTADNLYYRGTTNDKPDEENAATAYIPITSINDFLNKSKVDNYAFAHWNGFDYIKIEKNLYKRVGAWDGSSYYQGYYRQLLLGDATLTTDSVVNDFLTYVDAVPYLENKLIDLSYYRDSKAISSKDYENCMNIINNDLRICNGYLLYWRNGYLVKQQTSVKMIADLTSGVQRIGAAVEDLIQNETESSFYDADKEADVNLTNELTQLNTLMLGKKYVDLNDYYDEYLNEYVNYEQKLFENVYYLQQYWPTIQERYSELAAKTKLEDSETVELAQYDSIIMQYWQNIVAYGAYTNYYFPSEYEESDLYNICEEPITKTLAYKGIYKRAKTTPAGYTTTTPENATPLQNLVLGGGYVFYINEDWQTSAYQTNVYVWYANGGSDTDTNSNPYTYHNQLLVAVPRLNLAVYGIDMAILNYLSLATDDGVMKQKYQHYQQQHNDLWASLYTKYGYMLSEADYNDTEAVNAQQLLQNAKAYFQDIQNPEIEYDISVLDIAALSQADSQHLFMGNPQYNTIQMAAPRITDQILLNIDAINSQPNILYDLTSKKLYIVGLSYDLRSDEIKYTVNYANYKDRFMKNLVKLISV